MRERPDGTNGASHAHRDDDAQPQRHREPYYYTDIASSYDNVLDRDPVANWHALADTDKSVALGLNPTAYVAKRHTYLDGPRSY